MGVPQHYSLALILFNIYMNDLGNLHLNSTLLQYADETASILVGDIYKKAKEKLKIDLSTVTTWFTENLLIAYPEKTKLMCEKCA